MPRAARTLAVVAAGASTAVLYGGMINVAATDRHWSGTEWALHTQHRGELS